jgi:hypothetical protein
MMSWTLEVVPVPLADTHPRPYQRHPWRRRREFEGDFQGLLRNAATGETLVIPGLWALLRGTDPTPPSAANPAGSPGTGGSDLIWFSAGINDEQDGLIGVLRAP